MDRGRPDTAPQMSGPSRVSPGTPRIRGHLSSRRVSSTPVPPLGPVSSRSNTPAPDSRVSSHSSSAPVLDPPVGPVNPRSSTPDRGVGLANLHNSTPDRAVGLANLHRSAWFPRPVSPANSRSSARLPTAPVHPANPHNSARVDRGSPSSSAQGALASDRRAVPRCRANNRLRCVAARWARTVNPHSNVQAPAGPESRRSRPDPASSRDSNAPVPAACLSNPAPASSRGNSVPADRANPHRRIVVLPPIRARVKSRGSDPARPLARVSSRCSSDRVRSPGRFHDRRGRTSTVTNGRGASAIDPARNGRPPGASGSPVAVPTPPVRAATSSRVDDPPRRGPAIRVCRGHRSARRPMWGDQVVNPTIRVVGRPVDSPSPVLRSGPRSSPGPSR